EQVDLGPRSGGYRGILEIGAERSGSKNDSAVKSAIRFLTEVTMSPRPVFSIAAAVAIMAVFSIAQTRTAKTLDIYVIDVEGGNAKLIFPSFAYVVRSY